MSLIERVPEDARTSIRVGRTEGMVVVTVRGEIDAPACERLARVLGDLIDGQGNMFVSVELPDAHSVAVEALEVFVRAADNAWAHNGRLTVTTAVGHWAGRGRLHLMPSPEVARETSP